MSKPTYSHFVLSGNAMLSSHSSLDDANTAAIGAAKTGKEVMVVALVSILKTKTEIQTTLADGSTSTAAAVS
jgi:hypothetical protein